jgi:hypothetical protein
MQVKSGVHLQRGGTASLRGSGRTMKELLRATHPHGGRVSAPPCRRLLLLRPATRCECTWGSARRWEWNALVGRGARFEH